MRKVGELKGKPIIEGNPNEIKNNQIHYKEFEGNINLSERKNGSLETISGPSGGGSSKVKYYNCIDGNARAAAGSLIAEGLIAYMNVYSYDDNGNAVDTYIVSHKMTEQQGLKFAVRHIAFLPISIVIEGGIRLTFNSFEEMLSMIDGSEYIELFKEITEEEFYKID